MRRHTYSTDNDYRLKTVAILGILAYLSGSWLSSALAELVSFLSGVNWIEGRALPFVSWAISPLTNLGLQPEAWVPTTGAMFAFYFWAFNKHLWRWDVVQRTPLVDTPDLTGSWKVYVLQTQSDGREPDEHRIRGVSEDVEENVIDKVSGEAVIEQSWRKIQIIMEFDNSTSVSLAGSFITDTPKPRLHYYYRNEPSPQAEDSAQVHHGMGVLQADEDEEILEGEYFTDRFRNTSGQIVLRRESGQREPDR